MLKIDRIDGLDILMTEFLGPSFEQGKRAKQERCPLMNRPKFGRVSVAVPCRLMDLLENKRTQRET